MAQNPVLPDLIDNTRHYDNVSSSMEVDEFLSSTEKSIDEQVIKKSLTEQSFDMATLQSYFGEKYFTERLVADKDLWKELKQGWLTKCYKTVFFLSFFGDLRSQYRNQDFSYWFK